MLTLGSIGLFSPRLTHLLLVYHEQVGLSICEQGQSSVPQSIAMGILAAGMSRVSGMQAFTCSLAEFLPSTYCVSDAV